MNNSEFIDQLLENIDNLHELGRQRAFELGNPFYAKYSEDGDFYRKELPTGEQFIVKINVVMDANDMPSEIQDTIVQQIHR